MFLSNTVKNVNNLSSTARRSSRMVLASLKYNNRNAAKKTTSSSTSIIRHFASKPTTGVVSSSSAINPRPSITRGTAAYLQTLPKAKNNASSFSSYPSYQYDFEDDDETNESIEEEDFAQHQPCNHLPDERSKMNMTGQGWDIDTVVKTSFIPGAGYGRFSSVDVPNAKTRLYKKPIMNMSSITSITSLSRDICIAFNSAQDLERFIDLYMIEAGRDRDDIVDYMSHYVFAVPSMPGTCVVTTSSMVINHGDPNVTENIAFKRDGDDLLAYSTMPIKQGQELYNDYRQFDNFPQFFLDFCKDEGVVDVVTGMKEVL